MIAENEAHLKGRQSLARLLRYCRAEGWSGYDPYDALNSRLLKALTLNTKLLRTAATQLVKLSPLNFRALLGIRKGLNPKGLALAARALILLWAADSRDEKIALQLVAPGENPEVEVNGLLNQLDALRSGGYSEPCWGYNFDWQSRAFFAPRGTPNVVCTSFAANAFLDRYELFQEEQDFEVARGACRFMLDRIHRTGAGDSFCFSYTPLDRSRVHNVNLLAAELLARVFAKDGSAEFREAAEGALRYTLERQREDGSWPYGEASSQSWIDGFHTGFLLVSLKQLSADLGTRLMPALTRGYEYYLKRFFLADSTPRYYHDKLYPVDVHSAAQAIVTFVEMMDLIPDARLRADRATEWAVDNLQDREGFFHFQRRRFYDIKIPYMRWSQAWMLYALSLYLTRRTAEDV